MLPLRVAALSVALTTLARGEPGQSPVAPGPVGATTPFWTIEAETGALADGARLRAFTPGDKLPASPTPELEASDRSFVALESERASVAITHRGPAASTLVLRASIPDAPTGGGTTATLALLIDGVFRQRVTLSSRQTWLYGPGNGMSNDPADGRPHVFFDETRVRIVGEPIAPGATVTLLKDSESSAAFYWIDCVDFENPPPPRPRPENSVSVAEHGAVADDDLDDTAAFRAALAAAKSSGKSVWIPAGRFILTGELRPENLVIEGAGMWHTSLSRIRPVPGHGHRNQIAPTGGVLRDFYIDEDSVTRDPRGGGGTDYGINIMGDGWLVERIWFHHTRVGVWATGTNGVVRDCRMSNTWGDGINLNNSHSPHPLKSGVNLRAENNFVRGAGDDGLATFSDAGERGDNTPMDGATFVRNTSVGVWWANGIRVAGGKNVRVENNLVADPVVHGGIAVGVFGQTGQPLESCLIRGNVIVRAGGTLHRDPGIRVFSGGKGPTRAELRDNRIIDALADGVRIAPGAIDVTLVGNRFVRPAGAAVVIEKQATGRARLDDNTLIEPRSAAPSSWQNLATNFALTGTNAPSFAPSISDKPAKP